MRISVIVEGSVELAVASAVETVPMSQPGRGRDQGGAREGGQRGEDGSVARWPALRVLHARRQGCRSCGGTLGQPFRSADLDDTFAFGVEVCSQAGAVAAGAFQRPASSARDLLPDQMERFPVAASVSGDIGAGEHGADRGDDGRSQGRDGRADARQTWRSPTSPLPAPRAGQPKRQRQPGSTSDSRSCFSIRNDARR